MVDFSDGPITSLNNAAIKRARTLLRRKGRVDERAFLVEGVRAVRDLLSAGAVPDCIYIENLELLADLGDEVPESTRIRTVTRDVLQSISDVPEPQGVVAEIAIAAVDVTPRHDVWVNDLVVVADGVRDPGNMGTLIRTAAAVGVTRFLITPNSVDPYNPKCVRAAMGAHFRLSIQVLPADTIAALIQNLPLVALTDANGPTTYDAVDWTQSCAIIVGSEAIGPGPEMTALATESVRIPLFRGVESLNAGVAGSHLVLEALRQRLIQI